MVSMLALIAVNSRVKLIFAASPLSTQHLGVRAKTS